MTHNLQWKNHYHEAEITANADLRINDEVIQKLIKKINSLNEGSVLDSLEFTTVEPDIYQFEVIRGVVTLTEQIDLTTSKTDPLITTSGGAYQLSRLRAYHGLRSHTLEMIESHQLESLQVTYINP